MNQGYVTLDEVLAAAAARAASLVPETSGYLALAIGDATARSPHALDDRAVTLSLEGAVSLLRRGDAVSPKQAARATRDALARLLAVSIGKMPGLSSAARPREESDRGVDAVVEDIEAALIPVNRAAARRALARLARETHRAKEIGAIAAIAGSAPGSATGSASAPATGSAARAGSAPGVAPASAPGSASGSAVESAPASATGSASAFASAPAVGSASATPPPVAKDFTPFTPSQDPALVLAAAEPSVSAPIVSAAIYTPTPDPSPRPPAEPTPTVLGMPPVSLAPPVVTAIDTEPPTEIDVATAAIPSPAPSTITLPLAPERLARLSAASPAIPPAARTDTRADVLLAQFGASCGDDAGMREAAACLRKIAGLELTPPPPAPAPLTAIPALRLRPPPRDPIAIEELVETTPSPTSGTRVRRGHPAISVALALVFGAILGTLAVARVRPDLLASITARIVAPAAEAPAEPGISTRAR